MPNRLQREQLAAPSFQISLLCAVVILTTIPPMDGHDDQVAEAVATPVGAASTSAEPPPITAEP